MSTSDPNAVQKTGDTMTGTLTIDDPGGAGNAILKVFDATYSRYVEILAQGLIALSSGGAQATVSTDGSGNVTIGTAKGVVFGSGFPATTTLAADTTTGDIIATATAGPNAGKKVNLTSGKWA